MAIRFDAATDVLTATNGLPGTVYTMLCWTYVSVDRNTFQPCWDMPATTGASAATWQYAGPNATGTNFCFAHSPAVETAGYTVAAGTWVRHAVVRNGTAVTYYRSDVNTKTLGSVTATVTSLTPAKLYVGGDSYPSEWLNGRIANMKLYNAVLTPEEIEVEFWQYMPSRITNLLRWHPFLTGDANGLLDMSGNGNNLTAGSTATATEDGPPIRWGRSRSPMTNGLTEYFGDVSLTAVASLTIGTPSLVETAAVSLSVTPTLTANGVRTTSGAVAMTATPTLSTTANVSTNAAVSMATTPSLSIAAVRTTLPTVSLTQTPSLTVGTPSLIEVAAVSLSVTLSLTVNATATYFAAISLTQTPTLTVNGIRTTFAAVSMAPTPTLTVGVFLTIPLAVNLTAIASLTTTANLTEFAAVSMNVVASTTIQIVNLSISAVLTLTVNGVRTTFPTVSLSATYTLSIAAIRTTFASVSMSPTPTLTVGAFLVEFAVVSMTATYTLTVANPNRTTFGAVNLAPIVSLTVVGIRIVFPTVSMTPIVSLATIAQLVEFTAVSMTVAKTLTVNGVLRRDGAVSLFPIVTLTSYSANTLSGAISLLVNKTLIVTAGIVLHLHDQLFGAVFTINTTNADLSVPVGFGSDPDTANKTRTDVSLVQRGSDMQQLQYMADADPIVSKGGNLVTTSLYGEATDA